MQHFAANVAKMSCRVQEDHVCSRDFAPLVKLAWEPPGQQARPVGPAAGPEVSDTAGGPGVGRAADQDKFDLDNWCGGVATKYQHHQHLTQAAEGEEEEEEEEATDRSKCWLDISAGIHTGSQPQQPASPNAQTQLQRRPDNGADGRPEFSFCEVLQSAGLDGDRAGESRIGRRAASEIGNRPNLQQEAAVASWSPPAPSPGYDLANHMSSRPVRVRKPPKTFISEMEEIQEQQAGACKRKRRAKNEAVEEPSSTTQVMEQAQVVLDEGLGRNANGGQPCALAAPAGLEQLPASGNGGAVNNGGGAVNNGVTEALDCSHSSSPDMEALPVTEADFHFCGRRTRSMNKPAQTESDDGNGTTAADKGATGNENETAGEEGDSNDESQSQLMDGELSTPKHHLQPGVNRRYKRKWRNQYGSSDGGPAAGVNTDSILTKQSPPPPTTTTTTTICSNSLLADTPSVDLDVGDYVWGKMRGFDWWPGLIVTAARANQVSTAPGHVWVCWFGDNQFSQIMVSRVRPLVEFRQYMLTRKPKALYRKAILECAEAASLRTQKQFPLDTLEGVSGADESVLNNFCDTQRQRHLLHWALGSFQPEGLEGLRPSEVEVTSAKAPHPSTVLHLAYPASPDGPLSPPLSASSPARSSPTPVMPRANNGGRGYTSSVMVTPRPLQQMVQSDGRGSLGLQLEKFSLLRQGKQQLAETCLCCGASGATVRREHPLFVGGICETCIPSFIECAYCFDEDGSQTYCCICADGKEVYLCDSPGCARSYCPLCIEKLCGATIHSHIHKLNTWMCFMCKDQSTDLLQVRDDWHPRLLALMSSEDSGLFQPEVAPPPPAPEDRRPIRVLGLFDGIGTGMLVLSELGIEVDTYISSEIDPDAVRVSRRHNTAILHVGAVESITSRQMQEWGPFDLVVGGSPCNDLSMANPARRGIFEGTGRLFFDFYRLLQQARPSPAEKRPFFWLFENVVSMRAVDKSTISRFLECNPSVVDAKDVSPAHRPRYFWGNLPGMMRGIVPWPGDVLSLRECVEPNCDRRAKFEKLRTITTKTNSIRQTKENLFPVSVQHFNADGTLESEDGDMLWCTEMERIFGFPSHYTDVGNMGRVARQRLLGRAWSTPVIRHLLAPLRDYFKTSSKQISVATATVPAQSSQ